MFASTVVTVEHRPMIEPLRHACGVPLPGLRLPASASLSLASCWLRPQQLLPVSAAGGGRRRCSYRGELSAKQTERFFPHKKEADSHLPLFPCTYRLALAVFFRMMSHEGIWLRRVSHAVIRTLVRVRRPSKASSRYCISATACIAWSETQRRPSGVLQSARTMASIFRRPGVPAR